MNKFFLVVTKDFINIKNETTGKELLKEWTELPLHILFILKSFYSVEDHHMCMATPLKIRSMSPLHLWFLSEEY